MNIIALKPKSLARTVATDLVLLGAVCLVPTLSHLTVFPLYKLNPMLLCMLAAMVLIDNKRNAYVMALLLPVVSMVVSGMPTPGRAVCMAVELLTVVALYDMLSKKVNRVVSIMAAIVTGKLMYYLLKLIVVAPATLVTTNVAVQAVVVVAYVMLFEVASRFMLKRRGRV